MGKHFEWRAANRLLNLRQEIIERHRRDVAVQPRELGGPCRREQILSCREHLPKFHKGWPELLECEPRALLRLEMRDFGRFPPTQYLPCMLEQRSDASAAHEVSKPVPHEHHADLAQAGQIAGRAEESGDHWSLFALLRLALIAQCIRYAGQYPTGKRGHTDACAAD